MKILIVEDNHINAQLFTDVLERVGYTVRRLNDGVVFIETVLQFSPDLILMDIKLPGRSGIELMLELREYDHYNDIQTIAITAFSDQEQQGEFMNRGFCDYIIKPVQLIDFLSVIQKALPLHNEKSGP